MSRIFGDVCQAGYIVRDFDAALRHWTEKLGIGPWFIRDGLVFGDFTYRGEPCGVDVTVALANSGPLQVELITPKNDAKSVYNDFLASGREGFHHFGIMTMDFDTVAARAAAMGMAPIMSCTVGSPARIHFYEPGGPDDVMIELIEGTHGKAEVFARIREAAMGWDGTRPWRDFSELR